MNVTTEDCLSDSHEVTKKCPQNGSCWTGPQETVNVWIIKVYNNLHQQKNASTLGP